ncbi:MAG: HesA/MoeB/ThiF family protein [Polyangiales bacterium]
MREVDVALVGLGGLGCPAAWALRRDVRSMRLIDEDRVERSNLHRQVLFGEADVGRLKVEAAADALRGFVEVEVVPAHLAPENAHALLRGARVVLEGSDNLPTKFLVSDVTSEGAIPVVHGACLGWQATVLPVIQGAGACYRCVFEELPEGEAGSCVTAGVFGPVTSVAGAIMAADAVRVLRGELEVAGTLARYDGWAQTFRATRFGRREGCRCPREEPPR